MALTYTKITTTDVASATNTVQFTSIPQTYTDLAVRISGRMTNTDFTFGYINLRINGDTNSSNYAWQSIRFTGNSKQSFRQSTGGAVFQFSTFPSATQTANAFGTAEIYIPNYALTMAKPIYYHGVSEGSSAGVSFSEFNAAYYTSTTAITSLVMVSYTTGVNWAVGSSFSLYGIKNS